jgi:hypothetical protein
LRQFTCSPIRPTEKTAQAAVMDMAAVWPKRAETTTPASWVAMGGKVIFMRPCISDS